MRRICFFAALLLAAVTNASSQSYVKTANGIETTVNATKIELQLYTPSTVRVLKSPSSTPYKKESLAVIASPGQVNYSVKQQEKNIVIQTAKITLELSTETGAISFHDNKSTKLFAEAASAVFTPFDDAGNKTFRVRQSFLLDKSEPIYGLGNLENGRLSQRGLNRVLQPGNVEDGIPFFQSVKGYGVFWDNYSPTRFHDSEKDGTFFESEVGDCVDYYFLYGGNADGVIAEMRSLTGQVPMFPLWTYGYWQSRERYKSQAELLEVVRNYREKRIPLDGIIQDWQYWGNNYLWNAMEFMNADFNRAQDMIDEVHRRNAHIIISIWSSFGPQTKPYRELNSKGMLYNIGTWPQSGISEQWPPRKDYPSGVRVYDAYNPEARDIYWKHLLRLYNMRMDGWWMDSTEPDHLDWKPEDMDTPTYLGSFRKMRSAYPLLTVGGVYDHQRKASEDKRVFILTRSGFAGQQRYGCNVWTGDVTSTWENLRKQVPAMLNFSLTGNPNVNSDLGGFFAGSYNKSWNDGSGVRNPAYGELYVRWMQMGVFTPMMRSHGTDVPREIYHYGNPGEPVFDALYEAIRLRYSLLPYIYSTSWQVTRNSSSHMRALFMDFPRNSKVWNIADEYMYGNALLVAPVLNAHYTPEITKKTKTDEDGWNKTAGAQKVSSIENADFTKTGTKDVYLPADVTWYDSWTNKTYKGGQTVSRETTLATIPIFVKAGSILPIGPEVQYATEKPWNNLEIRLYPGADGNFTLYEDEFDNYNYEKGAYSEIRFSWNDRQRRLTIDKRSSAFPGMLASRTFTIILPDGTKQKVGYDGRKTTVKL